jgi:membrane protein DedA with SNARE-associated domain
MAELLAGIGQWAVEIVYSFGYWGVFVMVALMNLHVLPLPTQLPLCLGGFLVGQGQFSFLGMLGASTAGAVAASQVLYHVGIWIGEDRLRKIIVRFERYRLIFTSDLDKAMDEFQRYGGTAILIGHLVPTVGALISVPAGLKRMPIFGRFMFYTILGSALWNGIFITLGWILGANWMVVKQYTTIIEIVVLAAMVGGAIWFVQRRWRAARKHS